MAVSEKFQNDPNWRDHILFYEYFHGDNGAGLGASHQTGWTGVVAKTYPAFWNAGCRSRRLKVGKNLDLFIYEPSNAENKMKQPSYPALYQINTRLWLTELSRRTWNRPATLDDIAVDAQSVDPTFLN